MAIPSRKWRRWHRWLGLLIAAPVLVLAVTGLLLNHLESLGLNSQPMPWALAKFYGVPEPEQPRAVHINDHWWVFVAETLYLGSQPVSDCRRPYGGAVQVDELYVVACGNVLLLMDGEGQLLERIGAEYGLPVFSSIVQSDQGLVLVSAQGSAVFDVDTLQVRPYQSDVIKEDTKEESTPVVGWQTPPARLIAALPVQQVPAELSWQRLLLDIHAGRVLPWFGRLVMDAAAILLIVLAFTGIIIWSRTRP